MSEKYQRFITEIIQLNSVARQDYANMRHTSNSYRDECDDYTDGYAQGYEDAQEYFGNMIDELSKILRNLELSNVMENSIAVSEKQLELL